MQVGDAINDPAGTLAGTAIVSDITFFLPTTGTAQSSPTDQSYLSAIVWQTGAQSVMNQVNTGFQYESGLNVSAPATRNIIQVDHSGGGRCTACRKSVTMAPTVRRATCSSSRHRATVDALMAPIPSTARERPSMDSPMPRISASWD